MATLIPIKHPDGTIEKITLKEFRARQKKSAIPAVPVVPAIPNEPPKPAVIPPAPKKIEPPKPAQPKKPEPIKKPEPALKIEPLKKPVQKFVPPKEKEEFVFGANDAKSPLEDELSSKGAGAVAQNRLEEAKEIIKKSGLKLNPETEKRLIGLAQLRLKDIRSESEARDWMMMPENQMGIGLNKEQAQKLLKMIDEKKNIAGSTKDIPVLKKPLGTPTALAKENRERLPAVDSPNNPFIHSSQFYSKSNISEENKPKQTSTQARPIMQDITPAKPMHLGPVEEIKFFTLVDFRRLSTNPEEAAMRLKQKFINLKEESYLLFINALEAWRQSPLFIDYINASVTALNAKTKLTEETNSEKITIDEIKALVAVEKDLL